MHAGLLYFVATFLTLKPELCMLVHPCTLVPIPQSDAQRQAQQLSYNFSSCLQFAMLDIWRS